MSNFAILSGGVNGYASVAMAVAVVVVVIDYCVVYIILLRYMLK